ncbi:MAG: hypothetical protein QXK43_03045 [Candidatus Jordarchaeales archaeon]
MDVPIQKDVLREVAPGFAVRRALSSFLVSRPNWPQITKIAGERASIQDFVKAAMAAYIYNYIGVRTIPLESEEAASKEAAEKEAKDLFAEITKILKDSFQKDVQILEKKTLLELAALKAKLSQKEGEVEELVLSYLNDVLARFSKTYLVDFLGDLLGVSYRFRSEFIKMTYGLKPSSIDVEEEVKKPHEEECVEIATHLRVKKELMLKEDEKTLEAKELKQLAKKVASHVSSRIPKDETDLKFYIEVYELKLQLLKVLEEYTSKKAELAEIIDKLSEKILTYLKKKAHERTVFRKVVSLLAGYRTEEELKINLDGVMMALSENESYKSVKNKLEELGIDKKELVFLIERYRRLEKIEDVLLNKVIPRLRGRGYAIQKVSLDIFALPPNKLSGLDELILKEVKNYVSPPPPEEFKLLLENKALLEKVLEAAGFSDVNTLKAILEAEASLEEVTREVISSIFFECMAHASRVVELYNRTKRDGERFKILFKIINDEKDENIRCMKEELLVDLLLQRCKEIHEVFPELTLKDIYGFIWARQINKTLNDAVKELESTASPLFAGVTEAKLNFDALPLMSYSAAFDISQRYLEYGREQMEAIQRAREKEVEAKERIKKEVYEKIEPTGLLEKKLTVALKAPVSVAKAELEWSESDTRKLEAMSKIFVRTEIGKKICPNCAVEVKDNSCPEHGYIEPVVMGSLEALAKFYFLSLKIIRDLTEQKVRTKIGEITFRDALRTVKSIFLELKMKGKLSPKSTEKMVVEGDLDRYLIPEIANKIAEEYAKAVGYIRKLK